MIKKTDQNNTKFSTEIYDKTNSINILDVLQLDDSDPFLPLTGMSLIGLSPNTQTVHSSPAKIGKTYSCNIEVFLKDSNAYGNVYFSRYFEWQGICREKWFSECVFQNMFELNGVLITKEANMTYKAEAFPFQKVKATLNTRNIRKTSFEIIIKFFDSNNKLLTEGSQLIVFADKNRKITRIPDFIITEISDYQLI